jgi:hypothetical protein
MAKKPTRGGRVTPKGTRPADESRAGSKSQPTIDHRVTNRFDPASQQRGGSAHAPTRAGHHRGNR